MEPLLWAFIGAVIGGIVGYHIGLVSALEQLELEMRKLGRAQRAPAFGRPYPQDRADDEPKQP